MSEVAMDGIVALGKAKQLINGVATGVSRCDYDSVNLELKFTCNDGTILRIPIPNPLTNDEIEMIHMMTIQQNADGKYEFFINGEKVGSKLCNFKTTIACSALPAGTVLTNAEPADVLEQILVEKKPPLITLTPSLDANKVYEIGTDTNITLSIKVNKQNYDLKKVDIISDPSLSSFAKSETITTSSYTYSGSMTINNTQSITVRAVDVEGLSSIKTIKFNFVYPTYLGYGDATDTIDIIEDADVISGMKLVRAKSALTTKLNSNDVLMKPMISYPKSFGELTSILDVKNRFEMIGNYDKKEIEIECMDGTMQTYYCYMQKTQVILNNFEIKFLW